MGFWVTSAANAPKDLGWIKKNAAGSGIAVVDVTANSGVLSVMGPRSRELLQKVSRPSQRFDNEAFPFGTWQEIDVGFGRCRAARITYVGELGWELHVSTDQMAHVYESLMEHAEEFGAVNGGYHAIETLRCEKGYRGWGHDISPDEDPHMAGLGFAVKWDKPEFIGKEALTAKRAAGIPKKRLVQLALRDNPDVLLLGGEPVLIDGQYVGYLTSGCYAFSIGCSSGMGYLKDPKDGAPISKKFLEGCKGKIEIESFNKRYVATPSLAPLFDPKSRRVQGEYDGTKIDAMGAAVLQNFPTSADRAKTRSIYPEELYAESD